MKIKYARLIVLICSSVFVALIWISAFAQERPTQELSGKAEQSLFREILGELRQLRIAVQSANLVSYRAQMLFERARLQQDHVARLTKQLEDLRAEITNFKTHLPQIQERSRGIEASLASESDPLRRIQIEAEFKALQQMVELQIAQQQQLQERETLMASQLQAEQATLNGLLDQLQEIEREMKRQASTSGQ